MQSAPLPSPPSAQPFPRLIITLNSRSLLADLSFTCEEGKLFHLLLLLQQKRNKINSSQLFTSQLQKKKRQNV
ncbi:hypothetical protein TYRP_009582 [Tyrophagus putrescentiae]|nr:hypothetical protein TYRP_009582 [Tyrophagus putrescentiae]